MPETDRMYISVDDLVGKILEYQPDAETEIVRKAYLFTKKAHEGQFRQSAAELFQFFFLFFLLPR